MKQYHLSDDEAVVSDGIVPASLASKYQPVSKEEVAICRTWIKQNVRPAKQIAPQANSYLLSHVVQNGTPEPRRISNGAFIQAAILEGYQVQNYDGLHAVFNMVLPENMHRYA